MQCSPESMRAKAEADARASGLWTGFKALDLATYTLARYVTSEVGDGTPEEIVAVGEAAVNYAKRHKLPDGVLSLLLYRQPVGHPNRGAYGPIHGPGGTSTAPYGRWAATSQDPTMLTLLLADMVMNGQSGDFADGAEDQVGMEYMSDPVGKVRSQAAEMKYWVGPLAGVNQQRTFLFKYYGVKPTSSDGAALLARGLWGAAQPGMKWSPLMPVASRGGIIVAAAIALVGWYLLRML